MEFAKELAQKLANTRWDRSGASPDAQLRQWYWNHRSEIVIALKQTGSPLAKPLAEMTARVGSPDVSVLGDDEAIPALMTWFQQQSGKIQAALLSLQSAGDKSSGETT